MEKTALEVVENIADRGVMALIVDKQGAIGNMLVETLRSSDGIQLVFVSKASISSDSKTLSVSFREKIPVIPDGEYTHMVVVYDEGEETKEILRACLQKSKDLKTRLVVVLDMQADDRKRVEDLVGDCKNASIIYVGDLFGGDVYKFKTSINHFLHSAKKTEKVRVANLGLERMYPVLLNDAIDSILQILFDSSEKAKRFFVFLKQGATQLSLAHMLQKINPLIKVDFVKEKKREKNVFSNNGEYLLPDNYEVLPRLKNVFESISNLNNRGEKIKESYTLPEKQNRADPNHIFKFIASFVIALLLLPVILVALFSIIAIWQLSLTETSMSNGEVKLALEESQNAQFLFEGAKSAKKIFLVEVSPFNLQASFNEKLKLVDVGSDVSSLIVSLLSGVSNFSQDNNIVSASSAIQNSLVLFQKLEAEKIISSKDKSLPTKFVSSTVSVLLDLFGFTKEKHYLILFQNNMELRPGGGFIGSYGLLTLNKGKVTDFTIHDVYDADGQLKGHVEPPFPIRRFLPSVHWYLRDSNFDPDFSRSASSSATFLQIETGENVDGVIGVDLSFVKSLLLATGPISVSDFGGEKVDAKNLFSEIETHSEKNFFPGSSQKKDFLRSLFASIKSAVFIQNKLNYSSFAKSLNNAIEQKHVLFAFSDSALQNVFTANGMSSSLWDPRVESKNNLNDFLGISEANLGINKVNNFIDRKVTHSVTLDAQGNIVENLTIDYTNKSRPQDSFGGDYKNYLRLILPKSVKITSILIDGKEQKIVPAITDYKVYETKNFKVPDGLEVDQTEEEEKAVFGFLVTVPESNTKQVTVVYELPDITGDYINYSLLFFKQPGIDNIPYNFTFSYPGSDAVISKSPNVSESGGQLSFQGNVLSDLNLFFSLSKK